MSKIAFLFPGQGAQTVGMGKEAWEKFDTVKQLFAQASDIVGYSIQDVCFEGPKEKLDSTDISQPALFVTSMAAVEVLKETNPEAIESCAGVAGLSLGEYSALAFSGAISFEDGLRLVQKRGEAMQAAANACDSGMVSVLGLDAEKVEEVCNTARADGEVLQTANFLCPGNIAVSGNQASCDNVAAAAEAAGAMKVIPLAVAGAFHTPIMDPAVESLRVAVDATTFSNSNVPVYCNVDAKVHSQSDEFGPLLVKQICSPVRWHDSMNAMLADGYDEFYEVGTGRVLRGLLKRINRKLKTHGTLDSIQ
ncbi:ACP S-malonyltransferase [Mariniblastus fucicola]|uniref:Malonyl CoA-acyl carrier protein transacylase n=1 Tax=Mariniblastus fucicola TaxID=980251 RepID=A0A5B9PHG2_9BACT|nr:ACP S-malonyltransferase [Mariniblastus fucicola]QEG24705.1 Malonyl CoA-acyl carrier protein transacylase [Mariniblastus fucicola]